MDIEQLKKAILQKKASTDQRFKLDMSFEDAVTAIWIAYKVAVNSRLIPYSEDKNMWKICKSVAKWITEDNKTGLLLFGYTGNGKTTMSKAICDVVNTLYDSMYESERKRILMVSALDLEKMIINDPTKFEMFKKCPMLYIDDLGMESNIVKSYGNELEPIPEILYYRYDYQLFTIATSNLTDNDLSNRYGDRIADRMREMFDRIAFTHKSFRI